MLGKMSKILRCKKGFTLVELMTVLIILGVILGIGVPKYLQIQAKAEWDADESTIRNFAKAAETYAASMNEYKDGVTIKQLIDNKIIDGNMVLNRINGSLISSTANLSYKNTTEMTVADIAGETLKFELNTMRGNVRNLGEVVKTFIGNPPYGEFPIYPSDGEDESP